ncbi:MAG: amino acid adenylation domain-containing protein [Alphaproteobacteria bacterium]
MATSNYNMGLRFKQIAATYPENAALVCEQAKALTYRELDAKSDAIAVHLRMLGVEPGRVVAIFADKHPLTYASMIACLKLGAPYVVLDTASPQERLDKILQRCQPAMILADSVFHWQDAIICPFAELELVRGELPIPVIEAVRADSAAYLMFTSGSTGFPKGVTIRHDSMVNFCDWSRDTFFITSEDKLSAANALYFDNSVFDFTASLFNGACLIAVAQQTARQPMQLVNQLKDITIWFSVPSLLIYLSTMRALNNESWPHIRAIIFGGEGYAKAELKKLYDKFSARATLWNVYGPTECTCICSAYAISEKDFTDMDVLAPLGHLAEYFTGLVLDEQGRQVADGATGELVLCGSQVALGYYNDLERTQAAFVEHDGQACYRTGDLVRKDPKTGYYHFSGRKDNQVKHMGYRIELEEVEAAFHALDVVSQAAVVYERKATHAGRLVAFVTLSAQTDDAALKNHLRNLLPSYMIPDDIHIMDTLPKNANGKIDRNALKAQL